MKIQSPPSISKTASDNRTTYGMTWVILGSGIAVLVLALLLQKLFFHRLPTPDPVVDTNNDNKE